jgi:hypothetical protein
VLDEQCGEKYLKILQMASNLVEDFQG